MKKYLFFAAAATLAACTQDTLIDDSRVPEAKDVAIGFATGTNNLTRAENSYVTYKEGLQNYHQKFSVWGYKNLAADAEGTKFTQKTVFAGGTDETAIIGYSDDNEGEAPYDMNWKYEPIRYWDKTATNYEFHAAAPQSGARDGVSWTWNKTYTDDTNEYVDGKGEGYFTIADQKCDNFSLSLDKDVANQTKAAFNFDEDGTPSYEKNVDLMIATDVTKYSTYKTTLVEFNFNHILSRLNIGVRLGNGVTPTYADKQFTSSAGGESFLLYTVDTGSGMKYYRKYTDSNTSEEMAQEVTVEGTTATDVSEVTEKWSSLASPAVVKDLTVPTKGVVVLAEVSVLNLYSKGDFYEDETKMSPSVTRDGTLSTGVTTRWKKTDETFSVKYGFPNDSIIATDVTFEKPADNNNKTIKGWNLSQNVTLKRCGMTDELGVKDFKMLYQGLIIPQIAEYESLDVTGYDLKTGKTPGDATPTAKPYLYIHYYIDGEEFQGYYNLASIFANLYDNYKSAAGLWAYKDLKTNTYVYTDGEDYYVDANKTTKINDLNKYYFKENGEYYSDVKKEYKIYFEPTSQKYYLDSNYSSLLEDPEHLIEIKALTNKDMAANDDKPCDIKLCEGWQNNIWITIDPTRIVFTANVFKWDTKNTSLNPQKPETGNESMKKDYPVE